MSIDELVDIRCSENALFPVDPLVPSDRIVRRMFVSGEVQKMLTTNWPDQAERSQWAVARAVMENFVSGNILGIKQGIKLRRRAMMCHLAPLNDGVWTVRATSKADSGVRIGGQFIRKDFFVGLTWDYRSNLGEGFSQLSSSIPWNDFRNRCKVSWRNLFHDYQPITGDDAHAYLSDIIIL